MAISEVLQGILKQNSRYLIAVSGGADSSCLLHAVVKLRESFKLHLEAAHVNHNLRASSLSDANFVRDLAQNYGVPFHCHVAEAAPSVNIESWARDERYRYFASLMLDGQFDALLTAHTANDLVETFLMRTLSNKELRTIQRWEPRRKILRPFLSVWRTEIEQYLKDHSLSFVHDESNSDIRFLRNRVRHNLIPFLEREFDGDIAKILLSRAEGIGDDIDALDTLALQVVTRISVHECWSKSWLRALKEECSRLHRSIAWRVVDELFLPAIGYRLGRGWSQRLIQFVNSNAPRIELPGKFAVVRREGGIVIERSG